MDEGLTPGGEGGDAVFEDATGGREKDLVFAGDFEEEESMFAGHGHPTQLAGQFPGFVPFVLQEAKELTFPFCGLAQRIRQPSANIGSVGEFEGSKVDSVFSGTRHRWL